jgi:signal peptidase I
MTADRKPWLAAVLSIPLWGLGHVYLGLPRQAFLAFLSVLTASLLATGAILWAPRPVNALAYWILTFGAVIAVILHAWYQARRAPRPYTLRWYNRWYLYIVLFLLAAPVVVQLHQLMRPGFVEGFRIPSASMEPTILTGDFLFVDKRASARQHLQRGTMVVFRSVEEEGLHVIKRIVGMPGDTLQMIAGALYLNGRPAQEEFVQIPHAEKHEAPSMRAMMLQWQSHHYVGSESSYEPDLQDWGPLVVSPDSFLVLGDNRDNAYDGRYWGLLPADNIEGQPLMIYMSYDPHGWTPLPLLTAIRWSRVGLRLADASQQLSLER